MSNDEWVLHQEVFVRIGIGKFNGYIVGIDHLYAPYHTLYLVKLNPGQAFWFEEKDMYSSLKKPSQVI